MIPLVVAKKFMKHLTILKKKKNSNWIKRGCNNILEETEKKIDLYKERQRSANFRHEYELSKEY